MRKNLRLVGRFLSISALGLWLGGFTVYTAFVVPIGHRQLGSGRFGFVTGQVTSILNVLSAVAVAVLLIDLVSEWGGLRGRLRAILLTTWVLILATLLVLVVLHAKLDGVLDYQRREIANQDRFQTLHERYELFATIQWACGLVYLGAVLAAWRRVDEAPRSSS